MCVGILYRSAKMHPSYKNSKNFMIFVSVYYIYLRNCRKLDSIVFLKHCFIKRY